LGLENKLFIDCRQDELFKQSHIKDAISIHKIFSYLANSTEEGGEIEMKDVFQNIIQTQGITGQENLIFYEDYLGSLKGVSCRGYFLFYLFGFKEEQLHILEDGLEGMKKNHPNLIEKGEEKERNKTNFEINFNKKMYIDYKGVYDIVKNPENRIIVDVRDEEEWKGESSSPYGINFTPRKGRIPGAKHLLWTDLMAEDGRNFKSENEIEKLAENIGLKDKEQEIIVYCFKGCRSANSFVALKKAGFKNVKNYLGSWDEWSRIPELPIDNSQI
jgi:thiosulfate/3-mercaptopyruvate sulfurtransferase